MTGVFALCDSRTGKRVGMASYPSRESAQYELRSLRTRDAAGGRPDLHELIPHLVVVELTAETFGSDPGDVIA